MTLDAQKRRSRGRRSGGRPDRPAKKGARLKNNKKRLARLGVLYAALGIAGLAVSVHSSTGAFETLVALAPASLEAATSDAAPTADNVTVQDSDSAPSQAADAQAAPEDGVSDSDNRVVRVKKGDTLMDILVRSGVPSDEAEQAVSSLAVIYNPRKLRTGQDVTVVFGPPQMDETTTLSGDDRSARSVAAAQAKAPANGPFLAVRFTPDASRELAVNRGTAGNFSAVELHKDLKPGYGRGAGVIQSSLFESAQAAGLPPKILAEMIRAFSYDVDFQRDIQAGDSFEILYEKLVDKDGHTVDTGKVVYAQLMLSGTRLTLYHYTTKDGDTDYYNQKGESVRKALLRTPIDGARLSSSFGMRNHPILGYSRMHRGVDFAAPKGTPIYAAGSGVVLSAGRNAGYGNYVEIRHDPEFHTAYGHLSRFGPGIHSGVRVAQGQVIGYVGMTGLATGPHLHYEVIRNDDKVNPLSVNLPSGRKLKGAEFDEFAAAKAKVNATVASLPVDNKLASSE